MSVDTQSFRIGMRQLGGAVNIITTHYEGSDFGLTATAVCSVSSEPPRLLACVNQSGITYKSIDKYGMFAVNTLNTSHQIIAETFAGMSGNPENERFHVGQWGNGEGVPVLKDALVSFICRVNNIQDVGTHGIILADIISITMGEGMPLFYVDGTFVSSAKL